MSVYGAASWYQSGSQQETDGTLKIGMIEKNWIQEERGQEAGKLQGRMGTSLAPVEVSRGRRYLWEVVPRDVWGGPSDSTHMARSCRTGRHT